MCVRTRRICTRRHDRDDDRRGGTLVQRYGSREVPVCGGGGLITIIKIKRAAPIWQFLVANTVLSSKNKPIPFSKLNLARDDIRPAEALHMPADDQSSQSELEVQTQKPLYGYFIYYIIHAHAHARTHTHLYTGCFKIIIMRIIINIFFVHEPLRENVQNVSNAPVFVRRCPRLTVHANYSFYKYPGGT